MSRVTKEWILGRLHSIEEYAHDSEEAHCMEKDLWETVLRAIAEDTVDGSIRAAASIALRSKLIPFSRWFA